VVVVNLSGSPAQGRIPLAWTDLPGRGLFVSLDPWQFHLLRLA